MMKKPIFFASTAKGLEDLLLKEIEGIAPEAEIIKKNYSGVQFRASYQEAIELILLSRFASRVFLHIESYGINEEKEIYDKARDKWWHQVFELNQRFKISAYVDGKSREAFTNTLYLSRLLKDAIADSFRDHHQGKRPSVDLKYPDIDLTLRIEKNKSYKANHLFHCGIWLDLCGSSLTHRGYRDSGHEAPLRENIAAACVYLSDAHKDEMPLINPMCGSGTLGLEAWMARVDIPPTYLRLKNSFAKKRPPFSFFRHLWFKEAALSPIVFDRMTKLMEESAVKIKTPLQFPIFFSDSSPKAVELARQGMVLLTEETEGLKFTIEDIATFKNPSQSPGILLINPPYGKRLEDTETLKPLYKDLGDTLKKNFLGSKAYVLTASPELSKEIGLKASRKFPLLNGNLDCRLLEYNMF